MRLFSPGKLLIWVNPFGGKGVASQGKCFLESFQWVRYKCLFLDLPVVLPLFLAYCTSERGRGREKGFHSCCCEKQAWVLPAAAETNSKHGPSQAPASRVCYSPFSWGLRRSISVQLRASKQGGHTAPVTTKEILLGEMTALLSVNYSTLNTLSWWLASSWDTVSSVQQWELWIKRPLSTHAHLASLGFFNPWQYVFAWLLLLYPKRWWIYPAFYFPYTII